VVCAGNIIQHKKVGDTFYFADNGVNGPIRPTATNFGLGYDAGGTPAQNVSTVNMYDTV
jgi:hypothetical protein